VLINTLTSERKERPILQTT